MKPAGRMKSPLVVDLAGQKMLAYAAYMSVFVGRELPRRPGLRPTMFDRVCQMLCACSMSNRPGGAQVRGADNEWAEVAACTYRNFPFDTFQVVQMARLRHAITLPNDN